MRVWASLWLWLALLLAPATAQGATAEPGSSCRAEAAALSPDGKTILLDCGAANGLWRLPADLSSPPVPLERPSGTASEIVFADDGRAAFVLLWDRDESRRLVRYDATARTPAWAVEVSGKVRSLRAPGDGSRLVVYRPGELLYSQLLVIDGSTGAVLRERPATKAGAATRPLSPDGAVVVAGDSETDSVAAIDVATGRELWRRPVRFLTNDGAEFAQGGKVVLAYAIDGFKILDPATGAVRGELPLPADGYPDDLRLSWDGERLLVRNRDVVRLLRTTDGQELHRLKAATLLDWFDGDETFLGAAFSQQLWAAPRDRPPRLDAVLPGARPSFARGLLLINQRTIVTLARAQTGEVLACWGAQADSCVYEPAFARFDAARDPADIAAAAQAYLPLLAARNGGSSLPMIAALAEERRDRAVLRYAAALLALGRRDEARRALEPVLDSRQPAQAARARTVIAESLLRERRPADALPLARAAVEALVPLQGPAALQANLSRFDTGVWLAQARLALAEAYAGMGRRDQSVAEADQALAVIEPLTLEAEPQRLDVMQRRAALLVAAGRSEAALAAHQRILALLRETEAASPILAVDSLAAVADLEAGAGRAVQAAGHLEQARDLSVTYAADRGDQAAGLRARRAELLIGPIGDIDEGVAELRRAAAGLHAPVGEDGREALHRVVRLYWRAAEGAPQAAAAVGPVAPAAPPASAPSPPARHHADIMAVGFSPDGRFIASASRDGRVILRATGTGEPVWVSDAGTEDIQSLSWSPASDAFLTSGRPLQRWRVAGGEPETAAPQGWPGGAYVGPRGRWLEGREALKVHEAGDGAVIGAVALPQARRIAASPDGERLAIFSPKFLGAAEGALCLFAAKGMRQLACEDVANLDLPVFSRDGTQLINSRIGAIEIRDPRTLKVVRTLDPAGGVPLRLRPGLDGGTLLWAGLDGVARVIDLSTGASRLRLEGHTDQVEDIDISPDGRRIVTVSKDATVRLWDAQSGAPVSVLGGAPSPDSHRAPVSIVAFSGDGARAVSASADGQVKLWDVRRNALLQTFDAGYEASTLDVDRAGEAIVVATILKTQGFALTGGPAASWSVAEPGSAVAALPLGGALRGARGRLGVTAGAFAHLDGRGVVLAQGSLPFDVEAIAVARDGRLAAFAGPGGAAVYDLAARRILCQADVAAAAASLNSGSDMFRVGFAVDGQLVVAGDFVGVWESAGCKLVRAYGAEEAPQAIQAVAFGGPLPRLSDQLAAGGEAAELIGFAPDGAVAAALWEDGRFALVEGSSGRVLALLKVTQVNNFAFSPDGSRLLVATDAGPYLFDGRTGAFLAILGD